MYQVDQGAYWQAQLMFWGPKVLIAALILLATWIVARAVKWMLQKAIDRSPALNSVWDTCFAVLFLKRATRPLDVASTDRFHASR